MFFFFNWERTCLGNSQLMQLLFSLERYFSFSGWISMLLSGPAFLVVRLVMKIRQPVFVCRVCQHRAFHTHSTAEGNKFLQYCLQNKSSTSRSTQLYFLQRQLWFLDSSLPVIMCCIEIETCLPKYSISTISPIVDSFSLQCMLVDVFDI